MLTGLVRSTGQYVSYHVDDHGRVFVLYCTISHMKCALFLLSFFIYITSKRF